MTFDSSRIFQIAGNAVATDSAFLHFVSKKDAAWAEYSRSAGHIGGIAGGAIGGLIGGIIDGAIKKKPLRRVNWPNSGERTPTRVL